MPHRKPAPKPLVPMSDSYPHLCRWVAEFGTLEIGYDQETRSFIRVLDAGGMVWHGRRRYRSLDAALADAEAGIARFLKEELGVKDDA
jgi:hypothetical protein